MGISDQLLFFFGGIGVFNGALMGLYFLFFTGKRKKLQNQLFGFLLLMLSLRIGKSIFFYFVKDLSKDFLQFGLSACLFIGIFLLLYIKTSLDDRDNLLLEEKWQFYGLGMLTICLALFLPYRDYSNSWNAYVVIGIYSIWIFYIILTGIRLREVFHKFITNGKKLDILEEWLLLVYFVNVLICLVFNSVLYFGVPSYIVGPITFSFTFYLLTLFLLFHPQRKAIIHGVETRYLNKKIDTSQALEIHKGLDDLMSEQLWYRKTDLKLPQVAAELQIKPHLLSQYLNDNQGKSFSAYINEQRIKAACDLLKTDHQFTVEGVGYEVGFRSKSNFYATFKKQEGCTPNQYVQSWKLGSK